MRLVPLRQSSTSRQFSRHRIFRVVLPTNFSHETHIAASKASVSSTQPTRHQALSDPPASAKLAGCDCALSTRRLQQLHILLQQGAYQPGSWKPETAFHISKQSSWRLVEWSRKRLVLHVREDFSGRRVGRRTDSAAVSGSFARVSSSRSRCALLPFAGATNRTCFAFATTTESFARSAGEEIERESD